MDIVGLAGAAFSETGMTPIFSRRLRLPLVFVFAIAGPASAYDWLQFGGDAQHIIAGIEKSPRHFAANARQARAGPGL